jgi:hypothetical protein
VFTAAYGTSFGPVGWVLPSEVFPVSSRARGVALATASNWINNCLCTPLVDLSSDTHDHLVFIGLVTPVLMDVSAPSVVPTTKRKASLLISSSEQHSVSSPPLASLHTCGRRMSYPRQAVFRWKIWTRFSTLRPELEMWDCDVRFV